MRNLILTLTVLLLTGAYSVLQAQEELYYQAQQYQKSSVQFEKVESQNYQYDDFESFEFLAQVTQDNQDNQDNKDQQKDPENPGDPVVEQDEDDEEEKVVESNSLFPTQQVTPDSQENLNPVSTPTGSKKDEEAQVEEDESVLGFNFLYFLIQKFKISDILE